MVSLCERCEPVCDILKKMDTVQSAIIILSYCGWWLLHEQPTLQQRLEQAYLTEEPVWNQSQGQQWAQSDVRLGHNKSRWKKWDYFKVTASSNTQTADIKRYTLIHSANAISSRTTETQSCSENILALIFAQLSSATHPALTHTDIAEESMSLSFKSRIFSLSCLI